MFTYIWHKSMVNVGKYTIHGSYGNALLRDYQPLVSLDKALSGPCFLGGVGIGGVPLDCHDNGRQQRF